MAREHCRAGEVIFSGSVHDEHNAARCWLEVSMLRTASAASVLIAALPLFGVLPSSSAEAGPCPGYGCTVVPDPCGYFGDCARIYRDRPTYRTYRSAYDGPRSYGGADRQRMAPYFVNGCYNGYSADGVYCHYLYRCPYTGYRY